MLAVNEVAKWFLLQDDDDGISNLKLQKLLYYAQGGFLAVFDKPLFNAEIQAWREGPVVPEVYQEYERFGNKIIEGNDFSNSVAQELTRHEMDFLTEVYQYFGAFSAWKLCELLHEDDCWKKYYSKDDGRQVMPHHDIKESFKEFYCSE